MERFARSSGVHWHAARHQSPTRFRHRSTGFFSNGIGFFEYCPFSRGKYSKNRSGSIVGADRGTAMQDERPANDG
jgi:hypothetical protein